MLSGIVKFFNAEKQYGFITHEGKEIFFHSAFAGIMAALDGNVPVFVKCNVTRIPKADEAILFEFDSGERGPRATRWAFPDTYAQALEQIQNRAKFCLVERRGRIKNSRLYNSIDAKYNILWEGTNVADLRSMYPKEKYPCVEDEFEGRYFTVFKNGSYVIYDGDPR